MFQFPELGLRTTASLPVIVLPTPVPEVDTNPLVSTVNFALLKLHKPTFVASVAAIAWDRCTVNVIVLVPPTVMTGLVPAAAVPPEKVTSPVVSGTTGDVPDCMANESTLVEPPEDAMIIVPSPLTIEIPGPAV